VSALKAISDRQGPKVTTETRQVWLTEHSTTSSEVQPVEHMASVETSLIFNRDLIDRIVVKGPKALHRLALDCVPEGTQDVSEYEKCSK